MRCLIENELPQQQWLILHNFWSDDSTNGGIFCAIIPTELVEEALEHDNWELKTIHGIGPSCTRYYEDGSPLTVYHRFGNPNGIEPLVIPRNFDGLRPNTVEILEEFRLFHNLYWDNERSVYLKFDEAGNPYEVIRVKQGNIVEISKLHIRQFLALKDAVLIVFIDSVRYSNVDIKTISKKERQVKAKTTEYRYYVNIVKNISTLSRNWCSFSRFCGKRIIQALPPEQSGIWPFDDKPEEYPDYIIGIDENDRQLRYSCNPDLLSNGFSKSPNPPGCLTPVYFRKEVLAKYYDNPSIYSVEDGCLHCGSLWVLRMDNNLQDHVVVFLGDLGRDLPSSERYYWLSFNTMPQNGISKTAFSRGFLAEFTEPERVDLLFRYRFSRFNKAWAERFSWPFFLPLHGADRYLLRTIRSLLNESQAEFDNQILLLAKLLVDSLNEKELKNSTLDLPPGSKGIDKLEGFLIKSNFPDEAKIVGLFRKLQDIRSSGAAHRKGTKYLQVIAKQDIESRSFTMIFDELLKEAIRSFDSLADFFLSPAPRPR